MKEAGWQREPGSHTGGGPEERAAVEHWPPPWNTGSTEERHLMAAARAEQAWWDEIGALTGGNCEPLDNGSRRIVRPIERSERLIIQQPKSQRHIIDAY